MTGAEPVVLLSAGAVYSALVADFGWPVRRPEQQVQAVAELAAKFGISLVRWNGAELIDERDASALLTKVRIDREREQAEIAAAMHRQDEPGLALRSTGVTVSLTDAASRSAPAPPPWAGRLP